MNRQNRKNISALVVENEIEDVKRIQNLLMSRRIDSQFTNSAIEARAMLKESKYALMVLDIDLGGSGDEGMFLLDSMEQEGLRIPTVIVSNAGFMPEIQALRSKYSFVTESIDKTHLSEMLPVFDRAIGHSASSVGDKKPPESRALGAVATMVLIFLIVVAGVVGAAKFVEQRALVTVLVASALFVVLLGALVLRYVGLLTEGAFLTIVSKITAAISAIAGIGGKVPRDSQGAKVPKK